MDNLLVEIVYWGIVKLTGIGCCKLLAGYPVHWIDIWGVWIYWIIWLWNMHGMLFQLNVEKSKYNNTVYVFIAVIPCNMNSLEWCYNEILVLTLWTSLHILCNNTKNWKGMSFSYWCLRQIILSFMWNMWCDNSLCAWDINYWDSSYDLPW